MIPGSEVVRLKGINKTFPVASGFSSLLRFRGTPPRRPALTDITFAVATGEVFGLLGENGAGKSTILRLLSGLITADSGEISIAGLDARERSQRTRARVGLCTGEERSFYFRLTGRQNLEYFGRLSGVARASIDARIGDVSTAVDLVADLDRRFDRYSAGMRQRLAIARALLSDPDILLLDEPTRAVDPIHAQHLRALVRDELVGRRGKTIVLATNALDEAWELCDRIAILRSGRIAAIDAPAALGILERPQRYLIDLDRVDGTLLLRLGAIVGLRSATTTPSRTGTILRVEMDQNPRTLTEVLRVVTTMGGAISSVRADEAPLVDIFSMVATC